MTLYQIEYDNYGKVWCLQDDSLGDDYTVCGIPIAEGLSHIKDKETDYKIIQIKDNGKVTCPMCKRRIEWFRQLPKNCL